MSKGLAIVIAAALIGCGIAASGSAAKEFATQYLTRKSESVCWDASVAAPLNSLVTQEASTMLKASFPDDMNQKDQDTVAASFSATVSNNSFSGSSNDGASINCSGAISYTYNRADGSNYSKNDGNLITYELTPSKNGWDVEMSASDIPNGIVQYAALPPPVIPPDPPVAIVPAPAAIPPEVADYDQGHADRLAWETWFGGLQGPEYLGALFWSGQRSLSSPQGCDAGAVAAFAADAVSQVTFQNGCQEATLRLASSDIKRKADPLYKAGWNAPLPPPEGVQPTAVTGAGQ